MALAILVSSLGLSLAMLGPLGLKWEIGKKALAVSAAIVGLLTAALVTGLSRLWPLPFPWFLLAELLAVPPIAGSLLLWRFYRDPQRRCPCDERAVLSPADGRVLYVKRIEEGQAPISEKSGRRFRLEELLHSNAVAGGGTLIGIGMNFLDVHVNRAPISGRVAMLKRIPGRFISLKKKEALLQNERVVTLIDGGSWQVGVVQIASRLVRRIVPFLQEGQQVPQGGRIGAIRFGSQVDLILPERPALRVLVRPGQRVQAGLSVVAELRRE